MVNFRYRGQATYRSSQHKTACGVRGQKIINGQSPVYFIGWKCYNTYICTLMYIIRVQKKYHWLLIPICEFWNLSSKICVIQKRNKQKLHVVSMSKPPPKIMSWKINGTIKIKACAQDPKLWNLKVSLI